jgi:hypothetical protein
MKTLALLLFPVFLLAQSPALTLTGPVSATAGSSVNLSLALSNSAGQGVTALEYTVTPPSGLTLSVATPGAASTAATKTLYCAPGNATCIALGWTGGTTPTVTNTAYSDGVVSTFTLTVPASTAPGTVSVPLSNLAGITTAGILVSGGITSGATYTLKVFSPCDVLQSGTVTGADVQAMLNGSLGFSSCPFSGPGACSLQNVIAVLIASNGGTCTLQ